MGMWINYPLQQKEMLNDFKTWFLDAYEWPTTDAELEMGCKYRADFMAEIVRFGLVVYP